MGRLRAMHLYSDATRTLVAIESTEIDLSRTDSRCRVFGKLEPVALVVAGPDGDYAVDLELNPVDLEKLRRDVAGLKEIISR